MWGRRKIDYYLQSRTLSNSAFTEFSIKETRYLLKFSFLSERLRFKTKMGTVTIITAFFNKVLKIMKTMKKAKSLAKERRESSKEETEHLEPWSRIFDEAEKRHETKLNSLINTKKTEIQKTWLVLKSTTLFFLFTEKS